MTHTQAVACIRNGIPEPGGVWADMGAGKATFSFALAELLGKDGLVYAIDQNPHTLTPPHGYHPESGAQLISLTADFTTQLSLPPLDGILMANSLHYIREKESLLCKLSPHIKPAGKLILIEYDTSTANPWVPYPIPFNTWSRLAPSIGFSIPVKISSTPSRYGNGEIYTAVSTWKGL